jgi:CheY-like chemotaxis protein
VSGSKTSNGTGQAVTIFVVDDEPMLLDLAVALLQPLGYRVRTFTDPRVALKEFPAARPAVVVTDYAMGGMNGLDLVRECRLINPAQKMILLSGTVDEDIFSGLTHKPDRFMIKPYPVNEFIETIRSLAGS